MLAGRIDDEHLAVEVEKHVKGRVARRRHKVLLSD
jgi:hypothetical protein